MNKKGDFISLFIFIIMALIIVIVSGVFIYIQDTTESKLIEVIGDRSFGNTTGNVTIARTFAGVGTAYDALPWLTFLLIIGMIIGIMVGSYLVTTKPVMFIPFIFIIIIAIILGAGISNAYEELINNPTLSSSFSRFGASNFVLLHLPEILTVVGFLGAIIMFSRLGRGKEVEF